MDKNITKIAAALTQRFLAVGSDTCTIKMKADNEPIELVLCSDNPDKVLTEDSSILDFDYILTHGNPFVLTLMGNPERVCRNLARYSELKTEWEKEVEELKAYCEKHQDDDFDTDSYSWFSDWHKDLFSYRPIGWTVAYKQAA